MGAIRRFFSLKGRANRLPYWVVTLSVLFGFLVLTALTFGLTDLSILDETVVDDEGTATDASWTLVITIVYALLVLPVTARRLHDRAKSAWWLLPYLAVPSLIVEAGIYRPLGLNVPDDLVTLGNVVGYGLNLVALVDLGFLRGTDGPNRYGPDPLDPEAYDPREADVFD